MTMKEKKVIDPRTVDNLIDLNVRLNGVRATLELIRESVEGTPAAALYSLMYTLDGITHDLHAVTDGMEV